MRTKSLLGIFLLAVILSCGKAGREAEREAPTAGAWVDEIVFREEGDFSKAIDMIEAGEIHAYAAGINDPEIFRKIQSSDQIEYEISYGMNYELTLNPSGPVLRSGELNPFAVPAIREAVNFLIDRNHIVEEIFGGLAVPRVLPLSGAFPDYARLADVARRIELEYAHAPEKAKATITSEMEKLGAKLEGGKWIYKGKPVRLIFLIRSDDRRHQIGDYAASLFENLGFTVDRQYKTPTEASPIWIGSDPSAGRWHLYTGAWVSLVINRDQGDNFNYYYTSRGRPEPLWQAYRPERAFDAIADRLGRNDYTTWAERMTLMKDALGLSMKNGSRIWIADGTNVWPRRKEIVVAADLAGGIAGSYLYPYTLRFKDQSGGRVNFAGPSILTEPWNPVAGSNWFFDNVIMRATQDFPSFPDPYTGLHWPQRIESAEVTVETGLPVIKTHDWVDLKFVPHIEVPADAWLGWDSARETFVTAGKGRTARTKTVIRYSADLFQRKWHDGSPVTLADFVAAFILPFDRTNPKSPIFDEAEAPAFEAYKKHFRGARIVQADPLIVEVYSDQIFPDAELIAATRAGSLYSNVPWHKLALGILAERNKELAFSASKADKLKVEWMSYVAGPSLAIFDRLINEEFVPYANALKPYITADDAKARYEKLRAWRADRGHFWVGNGAFYLHGVHTTERFVVIRKFEGFPDPPDKWLRFEKPRIADVEVSGPQTIRVGDAAEFDVALSFEGAPYPASDVEFVRFLLFDARGGVALQAEAAPAGDGAWKIVIPAEETAKLAEGSNRLEVIATSRVVAIPSFKTFLFVTSN